MPARLDLCPDHDIRAVQHGAVSQTQLVIAAHLGRRAPRTRRLGDQDTEDRYTKPHHFRNPILNVFKGICKRLPARIMSNVTGSSGFLWSLMYMSAVLAISSRSTPSTATIT